MTPKMWLTRIFIRQNFYYRPRIESVKTQYRLWANFRPHMSLDGKTPAEKCGVMIEGNNKWLTLIQNSRKMSLTHQNMTDLQ